MTGRSHMCRPGAGGQVGVAKAIEIVSKEFSATMGLCGINRVAEIEPNVIVQD